MLPSASIVYNILKMASKMMNFEFLSVGCLWLCHSGWKTKTFPLKD